ncbi:CGNR zinc finger domain-containing protein [Microbacterium sp. NRRL B-14842]|uniref:CGNR zinc finger domain-containing protein n=1 Tax=Microbacterium sp. NRRL B-14842 TaxID=3162881 RepID=UPI003D26C3CF
MALIDVIRTDEGSRLTVCADETCQAIALDLSRNRSKRYCSTSCANRNAVAAYRAGAPPADPVARHARRPPSPSEI